MIASVKAKGGVTHLSNAEPTSNIFTYIYVYTHICIYP